MQAPPPPRRYAPPPPHPSSAFPPESVWLAPTTRFGDHRSTSRESSFPPFSFFNLLYRDINMHNCAAMRTLHHTGFATERFSSFNDGSWLEVNELQTCRIIFDQDAERCACTPYHLAAALRACVLADRGRAGAGGRRRGGGRAGAGGGRAVRS